MISFDSLKEYVESLKQDVKDPCGICHLENNKDSIRLSCSHHYHRQCLAKSNINHYSNISQCPYCSKSFALKTLFKKCYICNKTAVSDLCPIHKNINIKCCAILKSGKRKGQSCSRKIKLSTGYCSLHSKGKAIKCQQILKSGKRKGDICGSKCKNNSQFCGRHRQKNKIIVV